MTDSACPCPLPANDRGFALVAVIFVATIVAGLVVALLLLAQRTAQQGNDVVLEVENRAAGEAGVNRIILAYARPGDALREQLVGDGRPVEWEFADKRLVLRAQAESGKLDLNAGPRDHIGALAQRLLGEPEALARFLSRLDEARSQGRSITSVLMLLSPFDRMTARRDLMEAHFTVLTGQRGFDPTTAAAAVIETAPGLPEQAKQDIRDARAAGQAFNAGSIAFVPAQTFVSEKPVYTFRAETAAGFERPSAMAAQVGFSDRGRFFVYAWAAASPKPVQ
jgi:hypothetical protein